MLYFRIKEKYLHSTNHLGKISKFTRGLFLLKIPWKPLVTHKGKFFDSTDCLPNTYRFSRFLYIWKKKIVTPVILNCGKSYRRKQILWVFTDIHCFFVLKLFISFSSIKVKTLNSPPHLGNTGEGRKQISNFSSDLQKPLLLFCSVCASVTHWEPWLITQLTFLVLAAALDSPRCSMNKIIVVSPRVSIVICHFSLS